MPSFCMADAAKATSKSLEKTHPKTYRLMYWWYMIKNTDTKLAFVCSVDPGIYSSIVSDLKNLQLLPIGENFAPLHKLMILIHTIMVLICTILVLY